MILLFLLLILAKLANQFLVMITIHHRIMAFDFKYIYLNDIKKF